MWVLRGEAFAPIPPRSVASLCVDWCRILGLRCFPSFPLEQACFVSNPHTETPGMEEFGVFYQRLECFLLCIRRGFREVDGICYFSLVVPLPACMYLSLVSCPDSSVADKHLLKTLVHECRLSCGRVLMYSMLVHIWPLRIC